VRGYSERFRTAWRGRRFGSRPLPRLLFVVFLLALCSGAEALHAQTTFTFVQITDTHIGVSEADRKLRQTLTDIQKTFPDTAFIINTGDLTEMGTRDELTTYMSIIRETTIPVYNVPGNHDVRWSETGKGGFREIVGPTYQQFDYENLRFILLDTSMLCEHHGHFDQMQLERLETALQSMPTSMSAVLCFHHPPLISGNVDNDFDFAELIRRYNVPLVLVGHGHNFTRYHYNGTTYVLGGSTSYAYVLGDRAYRAFQVSPDGILPYKRVVKTDRLTSESMIPRTRAPSYYGEITLSASHKDGNGRIRGRIATTAPLRVKSATYQFDRGRRLPLEVSPSGKFEILVPGMAPGYHQLNVMFVDDKKTTHLRVANFRTDLLDKDGRPQPPTIRRIFTLPSGIQSSPVVDGRLLFIGCNDGAFRAFDVVSGELLWQQQTGAEIISTPAVSEGRVVVGSNDGYVYCFDKTTGGVLWKHRAQKAVMASPLIAEGKVFVGDGEGILHALDLRSGQLLWQFRAQKMIKMRPAYAGGSLLFGAWDNAFYSVNAKDGQLRWAVPVSSTSQFSAATAHPITTGTRVIFTSHDYKIRCLDQKTGAHLWLYEPEPSELGPSYSAFVLSGNTLFSTSISGRVVGFDALSGKKVFDVNVRPEYPDALFDSAPTFDGRYLYVGSTGGYLYCVDTHVPRVAWKVALQPGFIFSQPVLWGDRVLVATTEGKIFEILAPPLEPAPTDPLHQIRQIRGTKK